MSFLCCCADYKGPVYQIQSKDQNGKILTETIRNIEEIDPKKLQYASRVIRVEESQYQQLLRQHSEKNKWTDPEFPPGKESLGKIQNIPEDCQWKRISEILNKPELFDGKVQPKDVIEGSLGSCYFLSAVAALSEVQDRIYSIFGHQQFNPGGVYQVKLRVNGVIKSVLIDDYIPVNKGGRPLFCQPNKNQYWVIILEKAWAKINHSYANILSGTPTDVFQAVTYAPSNLKLVKLGNEYQGKLWQQIQQHTQLSRPCCVGAKKKSTFQDLGLINRGITPGHAYTLLDSATLEDQNHHYHRIMKLRDPWGHKEWQGKANENDKEFWDYIPNCEDLQRLKAPNEMGEDGIFYMDYEDFCDFFNEINFCHLLEKPTYEVEEFKPDGKHGTIYMFNVKNEDDYIIELHQSNEKELKKSSSNIEPQKEEKSEKNENEEYKDDEVNIRLSNQNENNNQNAFRENDNNSESDKNQIHLEEEERQRKQKQFQEARRTNSMNYSRKRVQDFESKKQIALEDEDPNRLTLILAHGKNYSFIDGALKYNEGDVSIKARLFPGKYFVYAKVDKDPQSGSLPTTAYVSSYSKSFVDIKPTKNEQHPKFFQKVFLEYARENKKKEYDDGKMWLSWKLFYEKGGYAFIAFGVDVASNKKFKIEFNQKDFQDLNFTLKKPHKDQKTIAFEVYPGHEEIVVARVNNASIKKMMFPPPLTIEIEELKKGYKKNQ